jgi:hypothetical protein
MVNHLGRKYRYQKFISYIAGQDINGHDNKPEECIKLVTDWLRIMSKRTTIPGGTLVAERYKLFRDELPKLCDAAGITEDELRFNDYATFVSAWIKSNLRVQAM